MLSRTLALVQLVGALLHFPLDHPVYSYGYIILHRGVGEDSLVPDPFLGKVLFKGSGGVFTTIV